MRRALSFSVCICVACGAAGRQPATERAESTPAVDAPADPAPEPTPIDTSGAAAPSAPAPYALGPPDAALAKRLRERHARVAPYLHAETDDGELKVDPLDLDFLLEYAIKRLVSHAGESSKRALRDDGQRFVRAAWLDEMATPAEQGGFSHVRIPLIWCVGWGCEVPSDFVAHDCFGPTAFFVDPTDHPALDECRACGDAPDDAREACEESKCDLLVEGHFTGEVTEVAETDPECSRAPRFAVTHVVSEGTPYDLLIPAGGTTPTP